MLIEIQNQIQNRILLASEERMREQSRLLLRAGRVLQFHLFQQDGWSDDTCRRRQFVASGQAVHNECVIADSFDLPKRSDRNGLRERTANQLFVSV